MTVTNAYAVDAATTGTLELDSGDDGFSWDEASVVQIDHPPHEAAFDTDRFYKIPLTAARPVEQTYQGVDGDVTMLKPPEELRQAAWSLDNAPMTLGHPSSRIVDAVDKVHGFTRDPNWNNDEQRLEAHGYIPVTDSEAKHWIEDNDGISIGFWYETDTSASNVDAYQRDLLVDHVAIVDEGRCSREDGCGLAADHASAISGFVADDTATCSDGECSCGMHVAETDRPTEDRHWTDYAKVSLDHQQSSRSVTVDMATAPAPFYIVLHDEGDAHTRQNVSVGEQLGRAGPYDAYADEDRLMVEFDDPIREARTVYALLYYADVSGDLGDPIESQQGFVFDSAVVMPDGSNTRSLLDATDTADVASAVNHLCTGDGRYSEQFEIDAREVAGVTFDGLRDGKLTESEIPDDDFEQHYLYPADTKSDSSYPVVDGDGYLRRGNVDAAHQLGARGGVDADEHRRKLKALNGVFADADGYSAPIDEFSTDTTQHMDDNDSGGSPIDVGDLTVDAIAAENDAVADLKQKTDELQTELDEAKADADEYEAQLDAAKDEISSLEEELEAYRADEKQDLVDDITALTDTWDEDELMDLEIDRLEDRLSAAKDIATDVNGTDVEADSADSPDEGTATKYQQGEVYDLSDTA